MKTLTINGLWGVDFGVLYQLFVSKRAGFGKRIVSWWRPLAHCHGESRDIRDFGKVIDSRTIRRCWGKGGGLHSLPVCDPLQDSFAA